MVLTSSDLHRDPGLPILFNIATRNSQIAYSLGFGKGFVVQQKIVLKRKLLGKPMCARVSPSMSESHFPNHCHKCHVDGKRLYVRHHSQRMKKAHLGKHSHEITEIV